MPPTYPNLPEGLNLARGVRLLPIKTSGNKFYGVEWGKDRQSEFFATMEGLEKKIRELNAAVNAGQLNTVPTKEELESWRVFRRAAGDADLMDILAGWKAWRASIGKPTCDLTVEQAVDDYLKHEEGRVKAPGTAEDKPEASFDSKKRRLFKKKNTITEGTMRQKRGKLTHFKAEFGHLKLDQVTGEEIETWLESEAMEGVIGAAATFDSFVGKVREFYSHYSELIPKNPCADIPGRESDAEIEDKVYPVRDVARVLKYARDHQPWMLTRLATEFFVGVRFSTAAQLEKEDFRLADGGLDIRKEIIKTKKDRYLDCMPKNWLLWAKLGYNQADAWAMTMPQYMHAKSALFDLANVKTRHNGARHSLASYHVAEFNDPGLTATLLCHSNQRMLFETYLGKATQKEAHRYFSLTPKTVDALAA